MNNLTEKVTLRSDNGSELHFSGRIFAERHFAVSDYAFIRLRLYITDSGSQVYSVFAAEDEVKSRRHYVVNPKGDLCEMSDGVQTLTVPTEMLFAAVFGLCGIDPEREEELRSSFEEALKTAAAG